MQNLDQLRAKNALAASAERSGDQFKFTRADVAGFPALIIQNGILAAFAFADEKDKAARAGIKFACDRTAAHLSQQGITALKGKTTARELIAALSNPNATTLDLQRTTSEALVFFGYLKRFASNDKKAT